MNIFIPKGPKRYHHQRKGLRDIIKNKGVHALLFDPGTGKTATTLDYVSLLALKSEQPVKVLVIAPIAALDTWVIQSEKFVSDSIDVWAEVLGGSVRNRAEAMASRVGEPFRGTLPKNGDGEHAVGWRRAKALYVRSQTIKSLRHGPKEISTPGIILLAVSMDSFSARHQIKEGSTVLNSDVLNRAVQKFSPDLIVVDESHRIKSAGSNVSRSLARLTALCRRRIILTGTVMPNSPLDVYGQWRFLDPEAFGTNYGKFQNCYADMGGFQGRQVMRYKNLGELRKIMARRSSVALKSEVLDLPKTSDVIVPVHLSPKEQKAYDQMKAALKAKAKDRSAAVLPGMNRLTQILRLRQITSGFMTDEVGEIVPLGESRAQMIKSLVHDTLAGEKRLVIFAYFTHEIRTLERVLKAKGSEVITVTGDTDFADRVKAREKFGSDDPSRIILIAQSSVFSLSVNELVTASHAIYASLSLHRDDFIQSRDRLDRVGQTKPVTFWNVVVPRTMDEVILKSHQAKTNLEEAILRHLLDESESDNQPNVN